MKKLFLLFVFPSIAAFAQVPAGSYWQRNDDHSIYYFTSDRATIQACGHILKQNAYAEGDEILSSFFVFDNEFFGFEKVLDKMGYLIKYTKVQISIDNSHRRLTLVYPDYREIGFSRYYPVTSTPREQPKLIKPAESLADLPGYWQRNDDQSVYLFFEKTATITEAGSYLSKYGFEAGTEKIRNIARTSAGKYSANDRTHTKEGKLLEWKPVTLNISGEKMTLSYDGIPGRDIVFSRYQQKQEIAEVPSLMLPASPKLPAESDIGRVYFPSLPNAMKENPSAVAVVIGNRNYQNVSDVAFAINDCDAMVELFTKTFGVRKGNLVSEQNITKSQFERLFGTKENPQGRLHNMVRPESDVFIYYSGHGSVDINNNAYLVPVELEKNYLYIQGYPLEVLYDNLSKLNVNSITIFIDACFSGEIAHENISPIGFRITDPVIANRNMVVLTATSGVQFASWDTEKHHGIFTQAILGSFENYYSIDENRDRKITVAELFKTIADHFEGVPYFARKLNNNTQTPALRGYNVQHVLFKY
jgi:hypothetical protein